MGGALYRVMWVAVAVPAGTTGPRPDLQGNSSANALMAKAALAAAWMHGQVLPQLHLPFTMCGHGFVRRTSPIALRRSNANFVHASSSSIAGRWAYSHESAIF